jgi:hypothetical protein
MSILKKLTFVVIGTAVLVNLSGCAMVRHYHETKSNCLTTPVLYSNLTALKTNRTYQLQDGASCTSFYKKVASS